MVTRLTFSLIFTLSSYTLKEEKNVITQVNDENKKCLNKIAIAATFGALLFGYGGYGGQ